MNAEAISLLQPLVELIPEGPAGDRIYYFNIAAQLGYAYKATGQVDQAIPLLEYVSSGYQKREGEQGSSTLYSSLNLAEAKIAAGILPEAEQILARISPIIQLQYSENFMSGRVLDALSDLEIAKGNLRLALDYAFQSEQRHLATSGEFDGLFSCCPGSTSCNPA